METNPYEPPKASVEMPEPPEPIPPGKPCPECGSTNTGQDSFVRSRPNVLWVLMFGWLPLLIRTAFSVRKLECRDCGVVTKYKTAGSWTAAVVLILLLIPIALVIIGAVVSPD